MKKLLATIIILVIGVIVIMPVRAQQIDQAEVMKEYTESKFESAKIAILKTLGKSMIDNRVNVINGALDILADAQYVASDVKVEIADELEDTAASLASLRSGIEDETVFAGLKEKVQSIIENYRVYLVQLPKAHGFAVVSHYRTFSVKLDALIEKVETSAKELDFSDESIAELTGEAKSKISSASSKLDQAEEKLAEMAIGWPTQAAELRLEARDLIAAARADLQSAFISLKEAVAKIKEQSEE